MISSLLMAVGSILILTIPTQNATTTCVTNIGVAVGLVLAMWLLIFLMLFLQVIHMVKCLKKYNSFLIAFYIFIVATIYVAQMMLWSSGGDGTDN